MGRLEPIAEVTSPRIGTVKGDNPDHRSGDHRPTGLLVVTGPGTRPGNGRPIQSTDIAPTIASLFGVRLPVQTVGCSPWRQAPPSPRGTKGRSASPEAGPLVAVACQMGTVSRRRSPASLFGDRG